MKSIVIDCNIFVSAALGSYTCLNTLDKAFSGFQVCFSDATLNELAGTLRRPRFSHIRKKSETILVILETLGTRYDPKPSHIKLPDLDDVIYLDLALAAQAEMIITGNKKHFPEKLCKGIKILSPGAFLEMV